MENKDTSERIDALLNYTDNIKTEMNLCISQLCGRIDKLTEIIKNMKGESQ